MAVSLKTQREIILPNANEVKDITTAKEVIKKLLQVIEDTHINYYEDLKNVNANLP